MMKPKRIVRKNSLYPTCSDYDDIKQSGESVTFIDRYGKKRTRKCWTNGTRCYVKDKDEFLKLGRANEGNVRTVIDVYKVRGDSEFFRTR